MHLGQEEIGTAVSNRCTPVIVQRDLFDICEDNIFCNFRTQAVETADQYGRMAQLLHGLSAVDSHLTGLKVLVNRHIAHLASFMGWTEIVCGRNRSSWGNTTCTCYNMYMYNMYM